MTEPRPIHEVSVLRTLQILGDNEERLRVGYHEYMPALVRLLQKYSWVVDMDVVSDEYHYLTKFLHENIYYQSVYGKDRKQLYLSKKAVRLLKRTNFSTLVGIARFNDGVIVSHSQSRIYDKFTQEAIKQFTLQVVARGLWDDLA